MCENIATMYEVFVRDSSSFGVRNAIIHPFLYLIIEMKSILLYDIYIKKA